jgi:hypothetical protein
MKGRKTRPSSGSRKPSKIRVRWLHPDMVIALPDAASHPVLGFRRTGEFTRLG